jgi:tetratricopeptide (TPR) repeat protein
MKPSTAITIGLIGGFFINEAKLIDALRPESHAEPIIAADPTTDRLARRNAGEYMIAQAMTVDEKAPAAATSPGATAPAPAAEPVSKDDSPTAAEGAGPVEPPTPAKPAPPPALNVKVDETALRYFAAKGDTKRLEAEIARLKALYPAWTPPENPLAVRELADPLLERMWQLYSEGKMPELRKAISDRRTSERGWQPPPDLVQRLRIAESREQLINASNLKQFDTVIRLGATNSSLLTCGDVDVLWRVAEAFAKTEKPVRAKDAYTYILQNCEKPGDRVATVQKAMSLVPRADLDALLALERKDAAGKGEFEAVRADIARSSVAAGADAKVNVPQSDVVIVEKLANAGEASDALLLGWYFLPRENAGAAEKWFRKAYDIEQTAVAAEGLGLSLLALNRPAEAEAVLYDWRGTSDETRADYLAAVANVLSASPPPAIAPEVLQRMVAEVYASRDATAAQQLGWYADTFAQYLTAEKWFAKALEWKPDDEPSAYGLALMRWKMGDYAGVQQVQTAWAGRSERIPTVGQPSVETAAVPGAQQAPLAQTVPPGYAPQQMAPQAGTHGAQQVAPAYVQQAAPVYQQVAPAPRTALSQVPQAPQFQPGPMGQAVAPQQAAPIAEGVRAERPAAAAGTRTRTRRGNCGTDGNYGLSPANALSRGWCLMDAKRPIEAAEAFGRALEGPARIRSEAAYGQSLAYMQAGLSDKAAIAATKGKLDSRRAADLRRQLLSQQAVNAYEAGRYHEALIALDERAQLVGEQNDLLVLRGYSYLHLRRYAEAEQVFRAAAMTGNRDALRGLSDVRGAREPRGDQ